MRRINFKTTNLFARFLVLAEQMVEDGAIFFVNALHFVDMFGHFLHSFESLCNGTNDMKCAFE